MSLILPCLEIFTFDFNYLFAVFFLGFIALLLKAVLSL